MKNYLLLALLASILFSCKADKQDADLLVFNGNIYTIDSSFTIVDAMAIKDGKILGTGTRAELEQRFNPTDTLNAEGGFIYPGFIDAHAHFVGYGLSLQTVNAVGSSSWEEVIDRVRAFADSTPEGWVTGRGWDQNDWELQVFPTNEKLNELFPDRPVILSRIDGHAAIANQKALEIAGIHAGDTLSGGEIDEQEGTLTGLLIDNAVDLVTRHIPSATRQQFRKALLAAQANCFAMGLTTIDDCGLDSKSVEGIQSLQESGELKMRLYVMLSDEPSNYVFAAEKGIIKTDRLHVRSFKVYGDGALGSRGACLLEPYSDRPGNYGFLLSSAAHFDSVASRLYDNGFQMCTHAIGDSGNRVLLKTYAKYLNGKNDRRWRIEHAQVISPEDFELFGRYSIIPSVQPTHATSDMYWAGERLGPIRIRNAYAYKQLLDQNGWLPLGTDFPVEDISTLKTFYSAVVRKDAKNWPEGGFQIENALSREQALRGMTIWAARANFEEHEKGSLETGKLADFVILDKDLMKAPANELLSIKVLRTFINGQSVYRSAYH